MKKLLIIIAAVYLILNFADYGITLWAHYHGIGELNPLVVGIIGGWMYVPVKILCPVLVVVWLVLIYRRAPRVSVIGLSTICALQVAVIGYQTYGLLYYLARV